MIDRLVVPTSQLIIQNRYSQLVIQRPAAATTQLIVQPPASPQVVFETTLPATQLVVTQPVQTSQIVLSRRHLLITKQRGPQGPPGTGTGGSGGPVDFEWAPPLDQTYEYVGDQVTTITDAVRETALTYTAEGLVETVTDDDTGVVQTFTYDPVTLLPLGRAVTVP